MQIWMRFAFVAMKTPTRLPDNQETSQKTRSRVFNTNNNISKRIQQLFVDEAKAPCLPIIDHMLSLRRTRQLELENRVSQIDRSVMFFHLFVLCKQNQACVSDTNTSLNQYILKSRVKPTNTRPLRNHTILTCLLHQCIYVS
ncbi:uncharacterized protein LOC119653007 isoform X3 [Hermetia illucens]|uniref:uncharacterized protein LOC119653007 isoform X3 n=1 Tax=Hermetia illucens TaxID=343691 RepID=UPI0018CBF54F|nr:uncharacterized protein LOC119653007 isoform X3 [Hermetia illucens]